MNDVKPIEPNEIIRTPIEGLTWGNGVPVFEPKPDRQCCQNCRSFRPKVVTVCNRAGDRVETIAFFPYEGYCAANPPKLGDQRWPEVAPWESCGAFKSKMA